MIKSKTFLTIVVIFLAQINCSAPRQAYLEETPLPVEIQTPARVKREQKFSISIFTKSSAVCHVGIGFWSTSNDWVVKELPNEIADQEGVCKWDVTMPTEAKDGAAELRGYIEIGDQSKNLFPQTFCLEVCR